MTDPIADMLTRIRNANQMRRETVEVPSSNVKNAILAVLKNEGYIANFAKSANDANATVITLKYTENNQKVIKGIKRISKPSLRVYSTAEDLPQVLNGLGTAIISTSQGIMSDKEARKQKIGGEVIAYIW